MSAATDPIGVLLDIDGVLYVGDEPIAGAHEALAARGGRASDRAWLSDVVG
jgi:ribonucleotide monophosphatase NagD (HAD superfamily)